jgi:hypothetical protein
MRGKTYVITKWCKNITDDGKDNIVASKPDNMPNKFRLLDDDGIIYAYGYTIEPDDDDYEEVMFEPLDDMMGAYGCTEIQYKNPETGEYETL